MKTRVVNAKNEVNHLYTSYLPPFHMVRCFVFISGNSEESNGASVAFHAFTWNRRSEGNGTGNRLSKSEYEKRL